jgi:hypothetical protein
MTDRNVNDVTDKEVRDWLRSGPKPEDGGMDAIRNLRPAEFLMLNLVQCLASTGKLNSDQLYRLNMNTNKSMLCSGLEPDGAVVGMAILVEETMLSAERREQRKAKAVGSFEDTAKSMLTDLFEQPFKKGESLDDYLDRMHAVDKDATTDDVELTPEAEQAS